MTIIFIMALNINNVNYNDNNLLSNERNQRGFGHNSRHFKD